jgi:pyruvate,water dikinase
MVIAQKKILKERNQNAERYKDDLLKKYESYRSTYRDAIDEKAFEQKWVQLTREVYLQSESTYFWQIFINTIHQSLYKEGLLKYVSNSEYIGLLSGIDQISHLLPFYDMWETSRKIRIDEKVFSYWKNTPPEQIQQELKSGRYYLDEVCEFIEAYGYHSDKELDVTYPCYYEDTLTVIKMFRDSVLLDDSCSPVEDKKRQKKEYEKQLKKIQTQLSPGKYKKLETKIVNMRKMLWWREEFRDVSTRFYYIIRIYTIRLAEYYVKTGVLQSAEDIWMLKIGQLWDYIDGKLSAEDLQGIIAKSRTYYNSFRNYMSDNEIGSVFDLEGKQAAQNKEGIYGLGCNNGVVTATARVIENLGQIDRLQQGDILITKFTDTGWTCKFAMLSGIVTEYGGILCHSAIVSREYGIPCIVCVHDVMNKIKDGSRITIDGTTGEVTIVRE